MARKIKPPGPGDRTQLVLLDAATAWRPPEELPNLPRKGRISFDLETRDDQLTELGPGCRRGDGYVVGIAVGVDDGRRFYLPIRHEGGGNLDERTVWRWARDELASFEGELVGANILYDLDWAATNGLEFKKVHRFRDVQHAEALLDEHRFQYNLDALAADYLGERKVEDHLRQAALAWGFGTKARDIKRNLWRLPASHVGEYGEGDADLPLRILPLQEARLAAEGLLPIWDIECRQIPLLLAMRRRGVRVSLRRAEEVRRELATKRDEWLATVRRYAGSKAELFEPRSLVDALRQRGLETPRTPKTNEPSITSGWLEAHAADPLCEAIWEARGLQTSINTFIDGTIYTHVRPDGDGFGRIHTTFNQLKGDDGGTIARYASENPNLQNVPARDEYMAPLIRSMFVPDDGCLWGRRDMSQVEYRLLVHWAIGPGAAEAREAYRINPKTDFHKMCSSFLGADPEDKFVRKRVKNTNFCKVYGGGIPKIAATFGCSVEEAAAFVATYDVKLPFVKETYDKAMKTARIQGYITTVGGRRQRFPFWEPHGNRKKHVPKFRDAAVAEWGVGNIDRAYTYTALNKALQCSAADLMKKSMAVVWESGVCDVLGPPLLTIHDELDNNVPDTPAGREAEAELGRLMETPYELRVPLIAEGDLGANWGETS